MTLRQLVELSQNVPPEWEEVKMNNTFATGSTVVTEAPSRGHPLGLALQIDLPMMHKTSSPKTCNSQALGKGAHP